MARQILVLAGLGIAIMVPSPTVEQVHPDHRHPAGAKIIISGTIVDPVCRFAEDLSGSAHKECAFERTGENPSLVLIGRDGNLYLLDVPEKAPRGEIEVSAQLIEQRLTVMGTVFPAGSAYLILVDSVSIASGSERVNVPDER